jgi:hypothetical protein
MEILNDFNDFVEFLGGVERDNRPKKVKSLKNYITGYYEGIKHAKINPHNIIKEMEEKDLIFLGLNSEVIYNF